MQPIFFLAALAMLAMILPTVAECDWRSLDHASIQIDAIPGGYRVIFDSGNCSYSAEGSEVLPALDALLASLWCDWAAREA